MSDCELVHAAPQKTADAKTSALILDLDGSVTCQKQVMSHLGSNCDVANMRDIGPSLRYLASKKSITSFENTLHLHKTHWLTMIGSGDFHHITASILKQYTEPFSLVVFDYHPDWMATSPWPCCGSWVLDALKLPNVEKIVFIGLGRKDISGCVINYGPVKEIRSGRIAFYPYDCPVSKCFGSYDKSLHCAAFKKKLGYSEIRWNAIASNDWNVLIHQIIDSLPGQNVYISVDKDCLNADAAATNWEIGQLTVDQITYAIRAIIRTRNVIGADITGEYSKIEIKSRLFRIISASDRPKIANPDEHSLRCNEETNLSIIDALGL